MKKNLLFAILIVAAASLSAQTITNSFFEKVSYRGAFGTTNWTAGWSNFNPQNTVYPSTTTTIAGGTNITTNTTWTKSNVYLLNGFVYVKDGATLTIEAGTVIRGDKSNKGALIVERGAKLIANGTVSEPIVFTSNQAAGSRAEGDWGGLILLGKAATNVPGNNVLIEGGVNSNYGGTVENDNSGSLKYVRLEFPGIALEPGNEINGLTMGGVGSGTTLDYIQVSYSGDDSYEWFGGSVNAKHLIAFSGIDDDFDTDFGYRGMVQFAVSLRDPDMADVAGASNSFESDNDGNGSYNSPMTTAIFSNVSAFGPRVNGTSTFDSHYGSAMNLKKNTRLQIYNTIAAGWPTGVKIENGSDKGANADSLKVKYSVISGMANNFAQKSTSVWTSATDVQNWFNTVAYKNAVIADNASLTLVAPFNTAAPNFLPATGSELLGGSYWSAPTGIFTPKSTSVNSLRIYPNPASTEVMVELPEFNGVTSIEVRDLTGKLLMSKNAISMEKEVVNVSELRKGMYIMVARQGNTTYNQKLSIR